MKWTGRYRVIANDADVNDILALLPATTGGDVARSAISKLWANFSIISFLYRVLAINEYMA